MLNYETIIKPSDTVEEGLRVSFFLLPEDASPHQTAGADPDHPDSKNPGRRA